MFVEKLAEGGLYITSAPTGAGKSTALENSKLPSGVVVSLDAIRSLMFGVVSDFDAGLPRIRISDEASDVVVSIALQMAEERLKQGLTTIVDGTFLQDNERRPFFELARRYRAPFKVLIFDVFEDEALSACSFREKRVVDTMVKEQFRRFIPKSQLPATKVSRDSVFEIELRRLPHVEFDIVGDSHGLLTDLVALLDKSGYDVVDGIARHRTNPRRRLLFDGDFIDRGQQSLETYLFVRRQVVEGGHEANLGNHEERLYRLLKHMKEGGLGGSLWPSMANAETGVAFMRQGQKFCDEAMEFFASLPSSYVFDEEGYLPCAIVHADLDRFEPLQTLNVEKQSGHSRHGRYDTDAGYQRRFDAGINRYTLIRGHIPHNSLQPNVFSLERKQVYRGELVLLRFDLFQELARNGDTRAAFNEAVVTQVCSFDFAEHQKKYQLLLNLDKLASNGRISKATISEYGLMLYTRKSGGAAGDALELRDNPFVSKARGIVLDLGGNIVQHPFDPCPGLTEVDPTQVPAADTVVIATEKLCGTVVMCTAHPFSKDTLMVTTKEGFASEGDTLPADAFSPQQEAALSEYLAQHDVTLIFSLVLPELKPVTGCNPGEEGVYLIGARGKRLADLPFAQPALDDVARRIGVRRPAWTRGSFAEVKRKLDDGEFSMRPVEGYVVLEDTVEQQALFKIKSASFLARRLLTNLADGRIKFMYANPDAFKQEIHPEVHPLVDRLTATTNRDALLQLPPTERAAFALSVA